MGGGGGGERGWGVTRNCSQHYFSHASSVIYTHTPYIKEVMHTNLNYMRCNERNLNFMLYDFYDLPRNRTTIRPYCVGTKKGTSWVPFHDNLSMTVDHNATGNGFIQTAIHARLSLTTLKPLTVTEHFTQISFFSTSKSGAGRSPEVEHSLMVRWVVGSIFHGVDPLSYFLFQPVLHDWCNKGLGMCYPVCGMVHIKEPLLLIDKNNLCGGSGFPFSLSEWSLTICLTPYNRR